MTRLASRLREFLTPELLRALFRLRHPWPKGQTPDGNTTGHNAFRPSPEYLQTFYDLAFHQALLPLSQIPHDDLMRFDFTELLPSPNEEEYPEQALGLIQLLDQQRVLLNGYGRRYLRSFFDPLCEKLARQLVAMPNNIRPDGKEAWLSRGYSFDAWISIVLWFHAPLVHADAYMTEDRQALKKWLHSMRAEIEAHAGYSDPFAPLEAADDVDIYAFERIESEGPPVKSYHGEGPASNSDYGFWWIRILNSHFAITDMCGHYPYWIRWKGELYNEKDKEFMDKTGFRYDPADEPVLQQVRQDYLNGVWQKLPATPKFEKAS